MNQITNESGISNDTIPMNNKMEDPVDHNTSTKLTTPII